MKMSMATVSLSGGLAEKLQAVAAAGFQGIEIFESDLLSFNGPPRDVRRLANDLGLQMIAFQPFRDFEGMPADKRERTFGRAERKFDVMQELGCDLLMVCSSVAPDGAGGIERAAADFNELARRAGRRNLRVAFEALAWGRHIHDYRDAWETVRRADHPALGLVLDSFHILARRTDLTPIASIPRDKIFLVHVADAPVLDMDYMSWSRHFRCFPGQGDLPMLDFIAAVRATGYDGLLSLEIFNDQFRAGSARRTAIDGRRSLLNLLDQWRAEMGSMLSDLPAMPPRSRGLGTAFIEFAIDESALPSFEMLLSGLGFRRSGHHISKAVTRWCQGDINIVTNSETDGFAHSFNITHGTGVCALGLKVEDAAATLERGQKLLDEPFEQEVGPGELKIPSVRGLGGSLVYFMDEKTDIGRVWDIEFTKIAATDGAADAGLTRVDHISQAMHYEEMLSWLLFYTSLLDVAKTSAQDVLDPGGVVASQVVQSPDGAVRIVLNASQSNQTLSSRFVSDAFGSGVQHIAFASDDLLATVKRLQTNGVRLLPIPDNYYDDLEARFEISPERRDELKAHSILYDRDGTAEFLQVYTQTVARRFFFEIVERRRDYRGFGAANAQIRLAAQARMSTAPALQDG